jgi:DNA-binding response OmpR family regulator
LNRNGKLLDSFELQLADHIISKHAFSLEELSARITVLAKRGLSTQNSSLKVEDLELDLGTMTIFREGKTIELNRACLTILQLLMKSYPNIVKRQDLEIALWGDQPLGSDSLKSHLYTLRAKIDKPFATAMLQTVHGIGYRMIGKNEDKK